MKSSVKLTGVAALIIGITLLFMMGDAFAVHKEAGLECSGCHSMHGTTAWNTTANPRLLKAASPNAAFCLACHDLNGTKDANAPGVVDTGAGNMKPDNTANLEYAQGAGGYFYDLALGAAKDNIHDMDVSNPTPPGGSEISGNFSCLNCHDPHGTSDTAGDVLNKAGTQYIDTFRNLLRAQADDITGTENDYDDTEYHTGFTQFCVQCHTLYIGDNYHPTDVQLGSDTITSKVGETFEYGMNDLLNDTSQPIIKPLDKDNDDDPTAAYGERDPTSGGDANSDDQVTCLTCHYAHGGPYPYTLRYAFDGNTGMTEGTDWTDGGGDTVTNTTVVATNELALGCQICHNK